MSTDSVVFAKQLATMVDQKKGEDVLIFDLRELSPITDFFVLATGLSDVHIKTIANHIIEQESPQHTATF